MHLNLSISVALSPTVNLTLHFSSIDNLFIIPVINSISSFKEGCVFNEIIKQLIFRFYRTHSYSNGKYPKKD